jgi:acetolactate synthase-1/2/3 large subunit
VASLRESAPSGVTQHDSGDEPLARSGARLLVDCLAAAGVRTVFGVPGDTGVDLYDALAASAEVRHVMARDERHAAKMADAYARCTNTVGVVEVSSGGGATFAVGGLGEPFASSVPVLLISSDVHSGSRGTGALTEIDQEQLYAAVTKWRLRVTRASQIPGAVAQALAAASSGRPAPVALIVPEDILAAPAAGRPLATRTALPATRRRPPDAELRPLVEALTAAGSPVIVAGSGVHLSEAWDELAALAERGGIPVASTIHGKGAYPDTARWSLGVVGANGGRDYANAYVSQADVVLLVGTRANATDTNSYTSPPRGGPAIYQIDIDAERAGRNFPDAVGIVGDAKATLARVLELLPSQRDPARDAVAEQLVRLRENWRARPDTHGALEDGHVSARAALRAVASHAPSDLVVVADCGTPTPLLAADWYARRAGRSVLIARGHGPMGFAIPAAVGAAFAHPERRILCVTTDGSFAMACGELETVVRHQLPITFLQLTNGAYGWIKMLQHLYFGRRYFGVDLGPVDAVTVARGFGIQSARVASVAELERRVADSWGSSGPVYLEALVPEQLDELPPVAPWVAAIEGDAHRPVY